MDRFAAPQGRRKIKKEFGSNNEAAAKETSSSKGVEETNGPVINGKDYPCVAPDTITVIAESIGISNIGDEVAASLAEDVSYKLQEVINASCTIMRKSKRRKLLSSDINSAFRTSNVHHILGHARKEEFRFSRLPEGDVFVADDHEVDLFCMANSGTVPKVKKPSYVATSYPILQSVNSMPMNGHTIKVEGKPFDLHFKSGMVNGDIKGESLSLLNSTSYHFSKKSSRDDLLSDGSKKKLVSNGPQSKTALDNKPKLNGHVKFAPSHGVREKLKRDSEEELILSKAQLSYFNVVATTIIAGHPQLLQQVLLSLHQNKKANGIAAPLLNFIAFSVCHVQRHFGFLTRLLDTVDVLLSNNYICPNHSMAVNRLVNALLAITSDQVIIRKNDDFFLRRKAAQLLSRVLLVWGIEEQHVSELLSRVAHVLGDGKEKIQSHYGALVIFQSLGKAAIGWLSPLLKCFLPLLDKRYPLTFKSSSVQLEEIRGVLLDIVELLFCDANSYRFKIKASTLQETQAMIHLDTLLYQYCGDAVCARRRMSPFMLQQMVDRIAHCTSFFQSPLDSKSQQQISSCLDLRCITDYPKKSKPNYISSDIFEEMRVLPVRRKDIQFKFAGANPVPKDVLRKKVLGKTLVQSAPVANTQLPPFTHQYLMVGRIHRSKLKPPIAHFFDIHGLYNVI